MSRQPYPSRVQILEGNLRAEHQLIHRLETQITELKANHLIRLERLMSDNRIYARMLIGLTLNIQANTNNLARTEATLDWILDNAEGESEPLLNNLDSLRMEMAPDLGHSGFLRFVNTHDADERWVFDWEATRRELIVIQAGRLVTDD